ncbi:MAG TPA: GNAT family N-acetyltransferase [Puia sp.]|jgi:GNAT superfamily N-acetyltransferase|nr:GNAT family N-acetyltransferase [Puia sp.]
MTPPKSLQSATPEQLEQAVAFNHKELFRQEAIALGGGIVQSDGLFYTTGTPHSASMIAFPELTDENAGRELDALVTFYLRYPPGSAGCWSLDPPQPVHLGVSLLARGFQPGWRPHWMALDLGQVQTNFPIPKGLTIVRDNESSLIAVRNLPYAQVVVPRASDAAFPGQWVRMVASIRGKVVGQSVVFLTAGEWGVAGIYHVGVVPRARGKGIGKAVTLAVCRYAKEMGYRYAVLNSTDIGRHTYRQLGFRTVGDGWTWWMTTERLVARPPAPVEVRLAEAVGRGDEVELASIRADHPAYDLNRLLTNGMSLIQLAVYCRQPIAAAWLVEGGSDYTALDAWDLGWKDRARQLLQEDRQQIQRLYGQEEKSLLHVAAERNDAELAELALSAGSDPHWRDNTWKATPLEWANHFGYTTIARIIQETRLR